MPCFTHLQRAQPIDAGAELLAWATMFSKDWTRLNHLLGDENVLYRTYPLGSGAIAGSTLPLDRAGESKPVGWRRGSYRPRAKRVERRMESTAV